MLVDVLMWVLIMVVVIALVGFVAGQAGFLKGRKPERLGVVDGRLRPASKTPNSVVSQAPAPGDPSLPDAARIAPLPLRGDGAATMAHIEKIVGDMAGATVVRNEPDYLYAQFTTRLMKYVDDTEFWLDPGSRVVHVRSASRLGQKDFGANRDRIEAIRAQLAAR